MSAQSYRVMNFTDADEIRIEQGGGHGRIAHLVGIFQDAGSMRFQHDMTPDQARLAASALLALADEADRLNAAAKAVHS